MGAGLSILLHLIFLFVLSIAIAFISSIITYFISNKEKKKRKVLLAGFVPFLGFFTLYFLAFVGTIIVSETKNVDIGIGDEWYAPLNNSCRIYMVDLPEQMYVECNGESLIGDVSHIQQIEENIYGKTYNGKYFTLHLTNSKFIEYANEAELIHKEHLKKLDLMEAPVFLEKRKEEVSGTAMVIVGVLSLLLTIGLVFAFCRLVLYGTILGRTKV